MTRHRFGRARLSVRAGALAMGLSLILSSCYSTVARNHQAASPATRPYYCNAVGNGVPPSGHGNGNHVHPIYQGMTKGPLTWDDCLALSRQLDQLLAAVGGLRTQRDSEAAGWREIAPYVPGLGTHNARFLARGAGAGAPSTFDPARPQFLIYGGPGPEAPLVGAAYGAIGTSNPPPAFAGANDWWHLHEKMCVSSDLRHILAGAEQIPDEECAALGGIQLDPPDVWLLHVWFVPNYATKFDIFVSGHPCLGESGVLPKEDPCWEVVNHDPADGPLPGGGHGEHGQ